jgi:hypothetical protein
MKCFILFVGLCLFGGGAVAIFVGRFMEIAARFRNDEPAKTKAFKTVMIGFLALLAGTFLVFGLPRIID